MQNYRAFLMGTLFLLLSVTVFSQNKKVVPNKKPLDTNKKIVELSKPPERPVKIVLKEGEPVSGTFINVTAEGVQLAVVGNSITVKWTMISQIIFTDVQQNPTLANLDSKSEKGKEALRTALKSFRKLVAATEILSWAKRSDFQEFGRRFIDAKAEVNEVLPEIPEGEAKVQVKKAMEAYDDAMTAWGYMFGDNPSGRTSGDMFPDYEPGKSLQEKYSIPTYTSGTLHLMAGDKVLDSIWRAARTYIENLEKHLGQ